MNFRLLPVLAMILIAGSPAHAEPFIAFADGDRYVYRAGWGLLSNAGLITITARADTVDGRPVMRITTTTSSRGLVRGFYRYDDEGEVVIDRETGRVVYSWEKGSAGSRQSESRTDFDYEQGIASHRDTQRPHRNTDLEIPEGNPIDLITSLVAPRHWEIQPGESRDLLVHFAREFFPLTLHAEAYENVKTPLGTFKALRMVPRMEKEEPRGIFERGGEIKVWISQDGERLPVRMQLKLKYGTATLLLQERTVSPAPIQPRAP